MKVAFCNKFTVNSKEPKMVEKASFSSQLQADLNGIRTRSIGVLLIKLKS